MKTIKLPIITLFLLSIPLVSGFCGGNSDSGASAKNNPSEAGNTVPKARRGQVVYMEGEVWIDGAVAQIGTELPAKASIRTGPASYCDIVFDGKNAVRITQNAQATLDFGASPIDVQLEKGGVTSVLRKLAAASGSDAFRVRTPSAVAGVRGTSFCVWSDGKETYICACNGTVHTIDAKGGNESILAAAHHTATVYTPAGESYSAQAAGMLHHTDESVESVAARIGEKIDWTEMD
jgi:hypothetical protein